ncbi:MAG TPA: LytTR family DNA-binding domain-containing protein [Candidatus Rifleibacterium sp.]|nr:LytTR family DNA-binding domain-containing protein [Candidatus Rifleibacterium sp.]
MKFEGSRPVGRVADFVGPVAVWCGWRAMGGTLKWGLQSMARGENDLLKQVLEKLQQIDPPIRKFPVTPEDPAMAVYFVDLKDVCYITTKADQGREETMFVCGGGKAYYSNLRLTEIEARLKEHPHFMRTSKFYVVNLTKIRGLKVSAARDLWFDGIKEPVINAVTSTFLADFEKKLT